MNEESGPVSSRSLALRFGVALPLLAGSLIAAFAYVGLLQPVRDGVVRATAASAGALLPLVGFEVQRSGHTLRADGERAVQVVKDCDGLPSMLLLLAAIAVTPTTWRRKVAFGAIGVVALFVVNQVRVGHLLHLSAGNQEAFRNAHETWWPAGLVLFAGALFLLWAARQVPRT